MTKVVTVTNQKGGTGKTTTSLIISYGLALRGSRVLLVDLDSQADASYSTLAQYDPFKTSLEVILGDVDIQEAIVTVPTDMLTHISLLPASANLATLDIQLTKRQMIDAQYNLSDALKEVKQDYDYIIIDTPPAISMALLNALTASDYVVIPTQADAYSLKGLGNLSNTIDAIKQRSNPELKTLGILMGRYDPRTKFTQAITGMLEDTSKQLHTKIFKTKLREAIAIKEAQGEQKNLFEYDPRSKAAKNATEFIDELLEDIAELNKTKQNGGYGND